MNKDQIRSRFKRIKRQIKQAAGGICRAVTVKSKGEGRNTDAAVGKNHSRLKEALINGR